MKIWIFIMKCSSFIYRAIIWSDSYQLSLPAGSIIVLTAQTSRTAVEENDKEQLFDDMNTLCFKKVTAFSVHLSDKMTPKQANAYKLHTFYDVYWQCTCKVQCVPLATEPGISLIILTPMKILQRNLNRSTLWCHHISYTMRWVRFKFRCNILISGKNC
jgi:hypothetical protein